MPVFESSHSDFIDDAFQFVGFNRNDSLIYGTSRNFVPESISTIFKVFRISVFGRIVHQIGEITLPFYAFRTTFDTKNQEIGWLGSVRKFAPEFEPDLPDTTRLLALVTFGLENGVLRRFYHITNDVFVQWQLINKVDHTLIAGRFGQHDLYLCEISDLDAVTGTFALNVYARVPFFNTLAFEYSFRFFVCDKDRFTVKRSNKRRQRFYFEFDTRVWVCEDFCRETTGNNFGFDDDNLCDRSSMVEIVFTHSMDKEFRVLKVDRQNVWKLVFQGPVPKGSSVYLEDRYCLSSAGNFPVCSKCVNSTLQISILSNAPCTLLEACVSVLWPLCRQSKSELSDYDICEILGLSKFVNMDECFGKNFKN